MVGDQKSFLFIQLKIATAEDLVQLAEDVALQISTSFFHLWNIYGVDDVYHDDDGNDHDLRQHMVMLKKAYDAVLPAGANNLHLSRYLRFFSFR